MARFLGIDFYWGESPEQHHAHGTEPTTAPPWAHRAAAKHKERDSCPCTVVCVHEGFWGKSYYCSSCGKQVH